MLTCLLHMQKCGMNKAPKSKAEVEALCPNCGFDQDQAAPMNCLSCGWPLSADIIARMEAMQQRFGRLQLCDTPPESERQILRCAPPFDAEAEHEADLRYESRVDYESWQYDGPEEREDV